MIPSPNLSCRTLSPGLYCWLFGLDGVGGGPSELFFCEGKIVGTEGFIFDDGRAVLRGFGLLDCGLPEPNTRPVSRDERVS